MGFTVPVSVNYSSPLNAVPLDWISPPVEGAKGIQCSIQWNAAQAGPNKSVAVNLQNNAPLNFSKVRALVFDNSANGSDVQVIFPDTETTMTIPSYTPYAVIPVFTNVTQFFIVSPNALSTDKTGFMILNTLPPPIAVPVTEAQNIADVDPIDVSITPGNTNLIVAGTNGTLENAFIYFNAWNNTAFVGRLIWQLVDGTGRSLAQGRVNSEIGAVTQGVLFQATDLRLRFENGIYFTWTSSSWPDGHVSPCLYYRVP